MKLRNKKTGEVKDFGGDRFVLFEYYNEHGGGIKKVYSYNTLAELNAEWEDYEPKEPLIKDEKICKAVRAWAEANDIERVWHEYSSCCLRCNGIKIELKNEVAELKQGYYNITELCGEEE